MFIRVDLICFIACIIMCIDQTFLLNLEGYYWYIGLWGIVPFAEEEHLE